MGERPPLPDDLFLKTVQGAGHPGQTDEEVLEDYREWAENYEQDILGVGYDGHNLITNKMCDIYDKESRTKIRILDVAAGTGLVGKQLRDAGFVHIDALDPSVDMLKEAKKRNIYENYFYEYLNCKPLDIKADTYDAITGSALFGHCHVPTDALWEMIRLVKPGGHIILCTRHELIHDYERYKNLEATMAGLEKDKKWTRICREVCSKFFLDKEAIVWHYQVL